MGNLGFRVPSLALAGIFVASTLVAQDTSPKITSVSKITTAQHQTITIAGTGFGTHKAYTGNSDFIAFNEKTKRWQAGYSGYNDPVTLIVNKWTNTQITLGGFAGAWGTQDYTLSKGDLVTIEVWNPQTGDGPARYSLSVSSASTTTQLRSSPNPSVVGEPVTFTAIVTSGGGTPPDGSRILFVRGEDVLGSALLKGGVAKFTTSALEYGANSIRAVYNGDANFDATARDEASATAIQTVQ